MNKLIILSLLLTGLFIQGCNQGSTSNSHEAKIDKIVSPLLEDFPGISIAVGKENALIWSKGYGYVDLESKANVTKDTKFRVYSISKLWTATAAAWLNEQGKLELDAPVQQYVEVYPEKKHMITPMQLAYHSAGIRHYKNDEEVYSEKQCESIEDALSFFRDDSLLFESGTQTSYSSWGYVLLSATIEGASDDSYLDVMDTIFSKAGMRKTQHYQDIPAIENLAKAYEMKEGENFTDVSYANPSCKWGAGGFVSSSEDVVRFNLALLSGKLVNPQFVELLLEPESGTVHYMGGLSPGGRALVLTDLETGLVVAILGNARGADLRKEADQIAELFAEEEKEID